MTDKNKLMEIICHTSCPVHCTMEPGRYCRKTQALAEALRAEGLQFERRGQWVPAMVDDDGTLRRVKCSAPDCPGSSQPAHYAYMGFCPNCGAKMG